ncbi:diguanylate cyclase (GGDEF)-like protein [Bradyrhizobium sp. GM2.2]|jgi:diguanylate cyclase (GGDEF)-like protein|uniref:GGDEF domain-containing protein n=1 Tax=Bradyrhizobium TaxID=374 RepID=UPI00036E90B7|nr:MULTISPECIES: GGDEF domain-containing protein [Bradyrhizobium]MBM7481363.1 diguanylate cyclase (GGDEF)-like protein [Bradyrhizobium canariense]MCK1272462.1 GGDEF domain-containing protein [Bradyrhizobium sp. 84]MCK1310384.1 GGDEF domain-containing protein [Bradyrhizobium sp. 45]MCK1318003.1 GGDEF domain-containing protein [Bradyrhizobium sp. 23]MCK1324337.1 GGDEF domain-containing protein [Bradyrhizobium sp. 156]
MSTAATSFPERNAAEAADLALTTAAAAPEVLARRIRQRRQMYVGQVASYSLGASVLLLYAYDGVISMGVPSLFWLGGLLTIGTFTVLSEAGFGDRFEDHYLTVFQISAHMSLQLLFLLAVPTVGVAFLAVLFLIFAFGTLRMTSSQAMLTWGLATCGLALVFLASDLPIGLPVTTQLQRAASMLCFVLVIGQCAFLGLFGATLRKILYRRSIELKAAYQRIEELAELDELTGSYNRRCIMRLLDAEIEKSRQTSTPCAIALIDLDWFKRINDAHGHPVGDEVLRTFAITIFANIRPADCFGRYGGEEFLLLLPGTDGDAASRTLDRLRGIVADLDWSAFSPGMRVTISAGVVTLRDNDTADTFLVRADSALYSAKAQGRNRIATS